MEGTLPTDIATDGHTSIHTTVQLIIKVGTQILKLKQILEHKPILPIMPP